MELRPHGRAIKVQDWFYTIGAFIYFYMPRTPAHGLEYNEMVWRVVVLLGALWRLYHYHRRSEKQRLCLVLPGDCIITTGFSWSSVTGDYGFLVRSNSLFNGGGPNTVFFIPASEDFLLVDGLLFHFNFARVDVTYILILLIWLDFVYHYYLSLIYVTHMPCSIYGVSFMVYLCFWNYRF